MISFKVSREGKEFQKYLKQHQSRVRFALAAVAHAAAMELLGELDARLPRNRDWRGLRGSLRLGEVQTASMLERGYVVFSDPRRVRKRKLSGVDPLKTVVYVRPKKRSTSKVPPEVLILAQYSPWTLDTLPYYPKKRDAALLVRKVSEMEVRNVRRAVMRDRPKWRAALSEQGVRVEAPKPPPTRATAEEDLAFQALRLEFGGVGESATPIWRPVIRSLASERVRSMLRNKRILGAIGAPKFSQFRIPPVGETQVSAGSLRAYVAFQKRLRV